MDLDHLKALKKIVNSMLECPPFPLLTIHDCFAAHPNNLNQVRKHYRTILTELADSTLIDKILSEIHGRRMQGPQLSVGLSSYIKNSAYGLC
jgi:hypothetical protein